MDEMNPKMMEFLAQDRIAELRSEAIGHQVLQRAATAESTSHPRSHVETTRATSLVWRLVHRAMAI